MQPQDPTISQEVLPELIIRLGELQKEVDSYVCVQYFNSQPVISLSVTKPLLNLKFTLTDVLIIGAITQSSILLTGSSGSGKTFLAELVLGFLFGRDGFARKNITPDMNEQDFMDIDFG